MPKTRVNCPNCRQPVVADISQLFDAGADPRAKQLLLSGGFNIVQCQQCGYRGNLATPLVYHDPEKELLLTYFPPELGLPLNEQERIIGPLITQVMNNLPQEKRKAYLLRPQTMLTVQRLVERILEVDGITREMIQAQQKRLNLLQRLLEASDEAMEEIIKAENELMDQDFFVLLARLAEVAIMGGDQESARRLSELQKKLLPLTSFGQQIQEQSREVEAAMKALRNVGEGLTREKLLDLLAKAPNDTQLGVMVSYTRPGIDYEFFQLLSDRIEHAKGDKREKLLKLRERLLELTREIDRAVEARVTQSREFLREILKTNNIVETVQQNLPAIDDFFEQAFNEEMEAARKSADLGKISKLQQIEEALKKANTPPPELKVIQELLESADEKQMLANLQAHQEEVNQLFLDLLSSLMSQIGPEEDPQAVKRIQTLYQAALRISMQKNLGK